MFSFEEIWAKPYMRERLEHYFRLLNEEQQAYYLICKQISVKYHSDSTTESLWKLHTKFQKKFETIYQNSDILTIIEDKFDLNQNFEENLGVEMELDQKTYLDLKIELAKRMLRKCEFCENLCGVNRMKQMRGFCGLNDKSYLSSAFLHIGEEAPLIPSGTIFFAGCSFDCCFCQNKDLSSAGKKKPTWMAANVIGAKDLAKICNDLAHQGALNINYVGGDPTPNIHTILESMQYQKENICQLWNSNFYNSQKALELLIDVIDLWLPDFKYGNNDCAKKYSKIEKYWTIICRNLKYIYQNGSKSIIVRHLVLPGHIECCTFPILEWIAKNIPNVLVNLMDQYYPAYKVGKRRYPELNRRITKEEMQRIYAFADDLDIKYEGL